ncbi:MAG: crossover junction endodeoxyribonuclease RuvC [Gammaproteobacteria bacterium]|jgi:crossover junction endodeoxyribonuclease RuvC
MTGYGVVDVTGTRVSFVDCGTLKIRGDDLGDRLCQIYDGVSAVVRDTAPAEIAAEKVFVHRNPASAIKLGQARGAAIVASVSAGLKLSEYSPNEIKQAVTGRGHADKQQIQHMVKVLLALSKMPSSDAADALAVAICHAHVRESRMRLARAAQALK